MNANGAAYAALAVAAMLMPVSAAAEIGGACGNAVGTFLTRNALDNNGRTGTSASLLILTNGGQVLRFDSDETGAAMDSRPFGNSAGTWRCDGADEDGAVRLTATMLDFTYPDAEGDEGQIARIDMTGHFLPETETLELAGKLGFLPLSAEGQAADALTHAPSLTTVTIRGKRIELPPLPEPESTDD